MSLTPEEAKVQLDRLLSLGATSGENEWVEFKEAKAQMDTDDLGKYFSALSNEANLKRQRYGWLVLGVDNNCNIVGTAWRPTRRSLDELKQEISIHTTEKISFDEIYEILTEEGRVLLFQVPAAGPGLPISWKGHYYGRAASSLGPLNLHELEQIRGQMYEDWSAQICEGATLADLDPIAIAKSRVEYTKRNPKLADDIPNWDDRTFLNKAKITIGGKVTRAAILLLGKIESAHYISPAICEMSWIKIDEHGNKQDFQHYGPPFILSVDEIYAKIQNPRYTYSQPGTLFPHEIQKYDPIVIRELLHNCIAHSDYRMRGRIILMESNDKLALINNGHFIPGSIENVLDNAYMPPYYRNHFLASAMVNLNMIETITSGIVRVFESQKNRWFPLPDYDLSDPNRVKVTVYGSILDDNYTKLLVENASLPLSTVILLDKVQKKIKITKQESTMLRQLGVVEGRYPSIFISSKVAFKTGGTASYIKNKAFDEEYYEDLVLKMLKEAGSANLRELEELLFNKLPDVLTPQQKKNKVKNLVQKLRREGRIEKQGVRKGAKWAIIGSSGKGN
jgi:ATP-dependent DNA helicase RecG